MYDHGKVVYGINLNFNISNDSKLENCLFGAVSLTKSSDIDKYKYPGYEIGLLDMDFFPILVAELAKMQ